MTRFWILILRTEEYISICSCLNCVAEEEIAIATKKQIVKAMTKNADDTRKGRTDKFPSIQQYVEPDDEAIEMFNKEHEELDRIARRVKKNLDKVIKERQKGDR